jgi:hypothetical protein
MYFKTAVTQVNMLEGPWEKLLASYILDVDKANQYHTLNSNKVQKLPK